MLANGNTNLIYTYPGMTKTMRSKTGKEFKLHVEEGQFADSEILVLLGTYNMIKHSSYVSASVSVSVSSTGFCRPSHQYVCAYDIHVVVYIGISISIIISIIDTFGAVPR